MFYLFTSNVLINLTTKNQPRATHTLWSPCRSTPMYRTSIFGSWSRTLSTLQTSMFTLVTFYSELFDRFRSQIFFFLRTVVGLELFVFDKFSDTLLVLSHFLCFLKSHQILLLIFQVTVSSFNSLLFLTPSR